MKLTIDTTGKTFTVTKGVEEKTEQAQNGRPGRQKMDRNTGEPLWSVQVMALDETGGEVISVTLAGNAMPKVNVGSVVVPVELEAMPWATNGRNGVAYRAKALNAASGSAK
ncbi:hypothetical protein [Kribbella sp. NPDC049584]|uniref:hypothetical protein n=1 Tax=Kribbella sp. NPDC049584 TaxID=3154833 RepID=UPI00341309B5